jgi:membrane-associated phospholipid phosphatase
MPLTNRVFWGLLLTYLCLGGAFLLQTSHGEEVLALNRWHSPARDVFFKYVTHLGDGLFCLLVGLLALWVRFRHAVQVLASYGLSALLAQLLKRTVFAGVPRPAAYFQDTALLQWVEGVQVHHAHSFPSGHTTSAFALFFSLALIMRRPGWDAACFGLAVLVALSRVYLAQHFLADTLAGAGLGVATAWVVAWYLARQTDRPWLDQRLGRGW